MLNALRATNLDLPAGSIENATEEITLRAPSELTSPRDIENTVVAERDGAVIRVRDIGAVHDTHRRLSRVVRIDDQLGLRLGIRKQSDANTVEVSQAVLAEVERINRDMPQLRVIAVSNQGGFIEQSISGVAQSVVFGGALAIVILLVFLQNLRSTLVIALSIPISLIATFALLYVADFTLNLMSLGGLALGVGMMVDNSIVVLDNIFRRRQELGESSTVAAVEGTREVGAAIIASTLTTIVIFLPVIFVRGISGQLFRELAYVVVFSLAASLSPPLLWSAPVLFARVASARNGGAPRVRPRRTHGIAASVFRSFVALSSTPSTPIPLLASPAFHRLPSPTRARTGPRLRRTLGIAACVFCSFAALSSTPFSSPRLPRFSPSSLPTRARTGLRRTHGVGSGKSEPFVPENVSRSVSS